MTKAKRTEERPKPLPRFGRQAEILLVEDNAGDILLTQEAFRSGKLANNLTIARDGEQAIAIVRKETPYQDSPTPDIILLDLNMPKMDGREVLRTLKSDPVLCQIPVIVMSSSEAEIDILKSYELQANAYIAKPIDFDHLKLSVEQIQDFWFSLVILPTTARAMRRRP